MGQISVHGKARLPYPLPTAASDTHTPHTPHTHSARAAALAPPARRRAPARRCRTLAHRRSPASSLPLTRAPPARCRSPACRRRTAARSPARSPARRPRYPHPHAGPATLAPAGHRSTPPSPDGRGVATPAPALGPPTASTALASPTSTLSASRQRVAGWRGCYATSLIGARAGPATLASGLGLTGVAGHNRCSPWQRSLLAAATLAVPTVAAPTVPAPRAHA